MTAITLITTLLIMVGIAFIGAAILQTAKIRGRVPPALKSRWCMMIALMLFFLIAYLLLLVVSIDHLALPTQLITTPVLLGGAFFVFIVVSLTRDTINRMKSAEENLANSEKYLRSIIETEPECVKLLAEDGTLLAMNPAGLEMVEAKTADMVLGKSVYPLITPECRDSFRKFVEGICCGNKGSCEFEIVGLKGTRSRLESYAVPFYDEKNKKFVMLSVTRDVTERRKLEEQLSQAAKMEAIGTLTGGIAHDFNNILTVIMGYGEILEGEMAPADRLRNYVSHILAASKKGAALIDSLLAFSRKQIIHTRAVEVADIVRSAEHFLPRLIGRDIELKTAPPDESLTILADPAQIERVLMNLASNARDAMPNGGQLLITTEQVELDDDFINSRGYGRAGRYALITVSDTGTGMDEETRERLFEPFFTTKGTGKGTGLGLSTAYGIIRQHNGYINVYSVPGKGSSFKVYLPLVENKITADDAVPLPGPPAGGTETVLLAEDDDTVRELTRSLLERHGYKVIEAVNGEDAIEKFMKNEDAVQLLLFDVVMPGKNGKEAYEAIKKIRPGVKIIFASGHPGEILHDKANPGENIELLSKPVLSADLLRKVREVLDK
jgi:two-component system cell cycle sensor histidine kinase/response regulator CckA